MRWGVRMEGGGGGIEVVGEAPNTVGHFYKSPTPGRNF